MTSNSVSALDFAQAQDFINTIANDPNLLFTESKQAKKSLHAVLKQTFQSYLKNRSGRKNNVALVTENFGLDQIWAQIEHHTDGVNKKLINNLTELVSNEDFLEEIFKQGNDQSTSDDGEKHDESEAAQDEDNENYSFEKDDAEDESGEEDLGGDYGDEQEVKPKSKAAKKQTIFDKNESDEELSEYMQGIEEQEMDEDALKLPADLEGGDDDDYDDEYDDEDIEGGGVFGKDNEKEAFPDIKDLEAYGDEDGDDGKDAISDQGEQDLEDVFAQAAENQEMDLIESLRKQAAQTDEQGFVNQEMVQKIEQLEDEMMNPKAWTMTGEATARERPINSLLEVHLDFNTATKLPPTITKESTSNIENLIKQRVLDELFDDPVLMAQSKRRKLGEGKDMDFQKSKKGLGDEYAEDMSKRLMQLNPEAFLEQELAGPDAALKREIEDISKTLFQQLEVLSNFHFVPKAAKTETAISTQNVPSLMLEEAVPIGVGKGTTKSAHEVFHIDAKGLREKGELSKEEKRKERAQKKRKIKAGQKARATHKKEELRSQGIALSEKFALRESKRQMEKMSKKIKKESGGETSRRTNASSKVFANLQKIVKEDYQKKEDKKAAKASGKTVGGGQYAPKVAAGANGSAKKFML